MLNELRENLIAIFVRRGHRGKEIVEEVKEILALIDAQRCVWTDIDGDKVYWQTLCGKKVYSPDDYLFCPWCGKRITIGEVKNV